MTASNLTTTTVMTHPHKSKPTISSSDEEDDSDQLNIPNNPDDSSEEEDEEDLEVVPVALPVTPPATMKKHK